MVAPIVIACLNKVCIVWSPPLCLRLLACPCLCPDGAGSDKLDPICEQPFVHLPSTSVAIDVRSIHCVPSKANQEVILNEG